MQERLQEILEKEHLTPARFAELIGVQRSSVSHILSGRNNPSLDFLRKILLHLEHINPDWLISGRGPYKRNHDQSTMLMDTKQSSSPASVNTRKIDFPEKSPVKDEERPPYFKGNQETNRQKSPAPLEKTNHPVTSKNTPSGDETPAGGNKGNNPKKPTESTTPQKKIIKTVFFYEDQTFEVFYPSS
ncbi:MAG: helix-turn-helix domain-containing protein [Bacteroidota bacterium]